MNAWWWCLVAIGTQLVGCVVWWRLRRNTPPDATNASGTPVALPWYYDPCLGQYLPDDDRHQTRSGDDD